MNSNEHKMIYRFRVHDEKEFYDILNLLKRRKFAICNPMNNEGWIEWKDSNQILNYKKGLYDFGNYDLFIRVYFNDDHTRKKFIKNVKRTIGIYCCGNIDCYDIDCIYHHVNAKKGDKIEYIWRCILDDEEAITIKD